MARSAVAAPRGPISCGSIRREPDRFKRSFLRGPRMKFEPTHVGCYGSKGGDRWHGRRWRLVEVPYPYGSIRREPDRFKRSFLRGPRMKFEPTHVGCYGSKEGDRWHGRRWRLVEVPYPAGSIRREPDRFKRSFLRGPRMKFEPTHVGCYGSKEGDRWRGRRWRLLEGPYPAVASGVSRITSNGRFFACRE